MPLANIELDLSLAGEFIVVKSGNRVNAINLLSISPGVIFFWRLGNNPVIGPVADLAFLTLTFGGDYPNSDVQEGFTIITRVNFPNARIIGFASMTTKRA
jgi:hypothetical protein